jgi:hypothetical protein
LAALANPKKLLLSLIFCSLMKPVGSPARSGMSMAESWPGGIRARINTIEPSKTAATLPPSFRKSPTIIAAVAKNKNLQLVLSIGDQIDPKQIGSAPNNALIVKQAPQLELLKQATVCITHAALNTVLESLAQGVPQLAIPITYDQPGIAARIAHKKPA